jgi:uncharacterized protein DUF4262
MHHEFEWPKPEDDTEADILRHVREYGCSIVNVVFDEHGKTQRFSMDLLFSYSVGLFANYDHPELILLGIPAKQAMTVINVVRDYVADGRKFVDGEISDEILGNDYKVCFCQVPSTAYPSYLGEALWFYDKCPHVFPCLQIVWQDVNRFFPWEEECDPHVAVGQPLLKKLVF